MVTVAQLDVLLRAPLSKLDKDLDRATQRFQTFGTNLTKVGAGLTARVTLPIVAIGGAALKVASDAQESENLFNVALGGMADQARRFSEEISDRLGISAFTIRENVGVLFQMTSAMGIAEDQALELATGLGELTQDLASFFNLRPEDAFRRLQSGIVGEIEPLRRLGILVDEQTSKQALLNKGLIKQGDELTQQQKVLGRYFAILEQTKNAQGDLERTSGDLANVIRRLRERFKDTGIELGQLLIPAAETVLGVLDKMLIGVQGLVKGFKDLSPAIQTTTGVLIGLGAAMGPVLVGLGQILQLLANLAIVARFGGGTILASGFIALATALASPTGLIVALGAVALGIAAYRSAADTAQADTRRLAREMEGLTAAARGFTKEQIESAVVGLRLRQVNLRNQIEELNSQLATEQAALDELRASVEIRGGGALGVGQAFRDLENIKTDNVDELRDSATEVVKQFNLAQESIDQLNTQLETLGTTTVDPITCPELDRVEGEINGATDAIGRMRSVLQGAAREVGLLDERARAFGPAFDVARERVAILEGALDDLFRLDQTPEVLAAIDSIAAQLAAAREAVSGFQLPPLTLNIEVPDFSTEFRELGRASAVQFVQAFTRGVQNLTSAFLTVFGRIFDRVAELAVDKLFDALRSAGRGRGVVDVRTIIEKGLSLLPGIGALFDFGQVGLEITPQLAALPSIPPATIELTPQLAELQRVGLAQTPQQLPVFAQAGVGSVAVAPAAQFTTIPRESLSPLTIHALARDPVVQSLSREIALVAREDGF